MLLQVAMRINLTLTRALSLLVRLEMRLRPNSRLLVTWLTFGDP